MREILENLHHLKVVIGAAGVIVALLLDRKLGPAEDDLPLRFKVILAVPVIVAIFQMQHLTADQRADTLPYLFALFVVAVIVYSIIGSLLGYTKEVAKPRPRWKFWGDNYSYRKERVMGGSLVPDARTTIQRDGITPQEYFEGTAYNQDRVWTRGSRASTQVLLVLTYIAVVFLYTATVAATVI